MDIIKKLTKKNCYLGKNVPKWIVVHETDNTDKGADAKRHAKAARNGNINSVHYYVDDHSVYQCLRHQDGAWAVGTRYGKPLVDGVTNYNSISIEICVNRGGDYEKARKNAVWLVRQLMADTGIQAKNVIRHYDAKKKWCPRKMMDNPKLWKDFKKRIQVPGSSTCTAQAGKPPYATIKKNSGKAKIKWMQKKLNECYMGKLPKLETDGIWGSKTQAMLEAYWEQLGWKKGTYCGEKTSAALWKGRKE